jgi:hypothetical protein
MGTDWCEKREQNPVTWTSWYVQKIDTRPTSLSRLGWLVTEHSGMSDLPLTPPPFFLVSEDKV